MCQKLSVTLFGCLIYGEEKKITGIYYMPRTILGTLVQFSSVAQLCPDSLQPHESQHARPPCHQLPEFTQIHVH